MEKQEANPQVLESPGNPQLEQCSNLELKPSKSSISPLLLSLLMLILGGSMVFAYFKFLPPEKTKPEVTPTTTPLVKQPTLIPSPATEKDETADWKTYKNEEAKTKYSLHYPSDWLISKTSQKSDAGETMENILTLTKNGNKIIISQFIGGFPSCLFAGDPDQEGPSVRFNDYKEFEIAGHTVRRAKSLENEHYSFCEKKENGFAAITTFGTISYIISGESSQDKISEMDEIVKTLQLL